MTKTPYTSGTRERLIERLRRQAIAIQNGHRRPASPAPRGPVTTAAPLRRKAPPMRTGVARAPGRISLMGGGTDLPGFYERHGGAVVSLAIPLTANATICERHTGLELVS